MALAVVLMLTGAAVLAVGSDVAVRGAARLARDRGLSPFVVGALLFGIDLESLGAALIAAGRGQTEIAAGESFGTIVFLFSAGFGVALLVARGPIRSPSAPMVLYPAATVVVGAFALTDRTVTRPEALGLVVAYAVYVSFVLQERGAMKAAAPRIEDAAKESGTLVRGPPLVLLLGGLVLVYVGATGLVEGGVRLLDRTGLTAGFVGAALIGALASADEVLLEVLPVRRGMPELATGNLFGTVAAFSTGVLGLAALVRPLEVDSAASSAFLAAAALYAMVAAVFVSRSKAGRALGVSVLVVYGAWLAIASRI